MPKKIEILVIALDTPLLVGIYEDGILQEHYSSQQKTSEGLLPLLEEVMSKYVVTGLIYANGPGSHMAIKLSYIMLRTIAITKAIPLRAVSAFAFNDNSPIKAMGTLFFIKEKETIITKKMTQPVVKPFELPTELVDLPFENENTPAYILPAV